MLRRSLFDAALVELGLLPIEPAATFWRAATARRWNGSAWVIVPVKVKVNDQWVSAQPRVWIQE